MYAYEENCRVNSGLPLGNEGTCEAPDSARSECSSKRRGRKMDTTRPEQKEQETTAIYFIKLNNANGRPDSGTAAAFSTRLIPSVQLVGHAVVSVDERALEVFNVHEGRLRGVTAGSQLATSKRKLNVRGTLG